MNGVKFLHVLRVLHDLKQLPYNTNIKQLYKGHDSLDTHKVMMSNLKMQKYLP